jgi:hypothetical protein
MQTYTSNFVINGYPNAAGLTGFPIPVNGEVLTYDKDANTAGGDPTANERCTWSLLVANWRLHERDVIVLGISMRTP